MYILTCDIQIGQFSFNAVHDVEITKSMDELSDIAVLKFPSSFKVRQNGQLKFFESAIQAGDKVVVKLGYQGVYFGQEFVGYVKSVAPKVPVEITCEDSIWLLRRKTIHKSFGQTTLKEILNEVVSGTGVELSDKIPDIKIDSWIINNANGAQVLESLQKELSLHSFIDNQGKLYCGLSQLENIGDTVVYDLNYNLVQNNLVFKSANDRKLKIKYTFIDSKNKRHSVEVGDSDGETREFHTSVVSDLEKLKKMAAAELEKLKYDGFDGDVVSFLAPYATRGMKAKIIDKKHPNRDGNYLIKKVVTTFGTSGARRTVTLGNKL